MREIASRDRAVRSTHDVWRRARAAPAALWQLRRSSLARSSGIYIVSNLINSAIPFALLPVLTRVLTPAEYGVLALFLLAVTLFEPLIGISTSTAVSRRYFDREEIDFSAYLSTCLYLLVASCVVVGIFTLIFLGPLSRALEIPPLWVWVAIGVAIGRYLVGVLLAIWQVQKQSAKYAVVSFLQTLGIFVLSIGFIVGLGYGWSGRAIGESIAVGFIGLGGLVYLRRAGLVVWRTRTDYMRDALKFGGGLVPHQYGALLIAATDRFLIAHMVGVDAAGLFIVGAQVALAITVLERSFNLAWAPWLFERLKRGTDEDKTIVNRFTMTYNVTILTLALLLAAAAPTLLRIVVGARFHASAQFVLWLALGAAFTGMYKMVVNSIFFYGKTYLLAWVTFGVGAINVVLTYFMIRWHGALGAAEATAISLFLSYAATLLLARKVERDASRAV
jgi:O-antigen/teichoic acid export membrane protein